MLPSQNPFLLDEKKQNNKVFKKKPVFLFFLSFWFLCLPNSAFLKAVCVLFPFWSYRFKLNWLIWRKEFLLANCWMNVSSLNPPYLFFCTKLSTIHRWRWKNTVRKVCVITMKLQKRREKSNEIAIEKHRFRTKIVLLKH